MCIDTHSLAVLEDPGDREAFQLLVFSKFSKYPSDIDLAIKGEISN